MEKPVNRGERLVKGGALAVIIIGTVVALNLCTRPARERNFNACVTQETGLTSKPGESDPRIIATVSALYPRAT